MSADKTTTFRDLHVPGQPLLMPNPWDAGSARLLAQLGFAALATTSSGHAASLGLADGAVGRATALEHATAVTAAVDVPVSADLENGFATSPDAVAATVTEAASTGLAGCSIEDYDPADGIYERDLAIDRVTAAVEAAQAGSGLVLTARAENFIRGNPDLSDTIARLQAYAEAGADVLYAPGLTNLDDIRRVVAAVDRPVNVLARHGLASVAELAQVGVARVSVGGAFHQAALDAVARAGHELLDHGTFEFCELAHEGAHVAAQAPSA